MFAFLLVLSIAIVGTSYGACPIGTYSSAGCFDTRSSTVSIDSGFRTSMDGICAAASSCKVKLYITDSYRKPDSVISGAIVPPAQLSNHKVGHAIDMNVVYGTSSTLCDSDCLRRTQPASVKCFIDAVKTNGLRWGGDFNVVDPVHIDDGYNQNRANYIALYTKIQKEC